jgi:selenocysteine lyase/cysteine desulfurase
MADTILESQRHVFEIPDDLAYFNAAAYVPLPRSVRAAAERGVLTKSYPWTMQWEATDALAERTRTAAAALLGVAAETVAINGAVSYGIATAARNIALTAGTRVLMIEGEYPSLALIWLDMARAAGAVVEMVRRPDDADWTSALLEAIERPGAPPVGLALLTPLAWSDGALIDLAAIVPAVRRHGAAPGGASGGASGGAAGAAARAAAVVIDATQAAGVLDLDIAALQPDFLAFPTYKWVCGPYSLAFLYADPKHHGGEPLEKHGRTLTIGPGEPRRDVPAGQPDARRFDRGERNDPIGLPMAEAGLAQVLAWDRTALAARLRMLTDALAEAVAGMQGIAAVPRERRAPHILGLRFAGGLPDGLIGRLAARGVHVAERQGVLRISPHVYNDEADVARFAAAMRAEV